METPSREPKIKSREKQDHTSTLEALIEKRKLQESIPNKERVFRAYNLVAERYQLSEDFLKDEVNQTLLLGACQKFTESSDPLFKERLKKYFKTLVAPSMGRERFDANEILGQGGGRGGLDKESQDKYIDSVTDGEATTQFREKYSAMIEAAKKEWKERGYDLNLDFRIVSDDQLNFKSKTGGTGFVNVPDLKMLKDGKADPKILFVLLKGVSDKEAFVKHELYHVEDYFDFTRRGQSSSILEGLDELHTEYAAGNYANNKREGSAYFVLKSFWNQLSHMGEIDFDSISDRRQTIEKISENFGLEGMTTFSLQDAQSSGSFSRFETFYSKPERTVTEMLIAKEKVNLRKNLAPGDLNKVLEGTSDLLRELEFLMNPAQEQTKQEYLSIYDFIISGDVPLYAHSKRFPPEKARELMKAYSQAVAFTEMYHQKEIEGMTDLYEQYVNLLGKLPHRRKNPNFNIDSYVETRIEQDGPYAKNEVELTENIYKSLIYGLIRDINGVDFAFSLQNPTIREQILKPFLEELDALVKHSLENKNPAIKELLIQGFYAYRLPSELREYSLNYISQKYPELSGLVDKTRQNSNVKNLRNVSI